MYMYMYLFAIKFIFLTYITNFSSIDVMIIYGHGFILIEYSTYSALSIFLYCLGFETLDKVNHSQCFFLDSVKNAKYLHSSLLAVGIEPVLLL